LPLDFQPKMDQLVSINPIETQKLSQAAVPVGFYPTGTLIDWSF
jgi:hypothetical protein